VLVVIAAIGAVGVTYARRRPIGSEATAREDYTAVAELSATGSTGGRARQLEANDIAGQRRRSPATQT